MGGGSNIFASVVERLASGLTVWYLCKTNMHDWRHVVVRHHFANLVCTCAWKAIADMVSAVPIGSIHSVLMDVHVFIIVSLAG